jgi:hypothetical protein
MSGYDVSLAGDMTTSKHGRANTEKCTACAERLRAGSLTSWIFGPIGGCTCKVIAQLSESQELSRVYNAVLTPDHERALTQTVVKYRLPDAPTPKQALEIAMRGSLLRPRMLCVGAMRTCFSLHMAAVALTVLCAQLTTQISHSAAIARSQKSSQDDLVARSQESITMKQLVASRQELVSMEPMTESGKTRSTKPVAASRQNDATNMVAFQIRKLTTDLK